MNPLLIPIVGSLANKVLDRLIASPQTTVTSAEAPAVRQEVANAVAPVIEHLTNNEPWYQSRVTWGAVFAILGGIATIGTAAANGETNAEVYTTAGMSILGGLGTLYGRWAARKPLGSV
jgi:hypothetical protein